MGRLFHSRYPFVSWLSHAARYRRKAPLAQRQNNAFPRKGIVEAAGLLRIAQRQGTLEFLPHKLTDIAGHALTKCSLQLFADDL